MSNEKTLTRLKAYWVVLLLLLAYILSFIDRNIMAILVGPIRDEFAINDFQYGILNGVAFSLLYTFLGIPIAWMADKKSRKNIIAIGTAFWSVMTFLCGLASGFYSLFIARMGVGVGEAALSPPAHSLLSDMFSKEKLPTIMAIFTLGIPVGVGVSYSLGGWIYGVLAENQGLTVPLLGTLKPWQATFMLVGLPGLVLAFFISRLQEPLRTGLRLSQNAEEGVSLKQAFCFILANKGVYLNTFFSISALSIVGYAFMMWFVEHMSRVYGEPAHELGKSFGWMYLVSGSIGTLFGAWFVGVLSKKGYKDAGIRVVLLVAFAWVIPAIAAPQMPSLAWAFYVAAPCVFLLNAYFGVSIAALQLVTPNDVRAQVSAVLLFSTNVAGLVIGPMIVGFLSDSVFTGFKEQALGHALSSVGAVFCTVAGVLLVFALKPYQRMLSALEAA